MRKLFLIIFINYIIITGLSGQSLEEVIASIPNPRIKYQWIHDGPELLGSRYSEINSLIDGLEKETSAEIALVIMPSIGENIPKEFATELFNTWKIGKKGKDNGLLIVHILDQRRIEIETGYGMEGIMPDVKCKWIIDEIMTPFFKAGSFSDGHLEAVKAVVRGIENPDINRDTLVSGVTLKPGVNVDKVKIEELKLVERKPSVPPEYFFVIIGFFIWMIVLLVYISKSVLKASPSLRYDYIKKTALYQNMGSIILGMGLCFILAIYHALLLLLAPLILIGLAIATYKLREKWLAKLRTEVWICSVCGKPMTRLSEKADDAYLETGQIAEEALDSLDYDVRVCKCGEVEKEVYPGKRPAAKCGKCGYKTFREKGSRIIKNSTSYSSGLSEHDFQCAHCGYEETIERIIPVRRSSSSSGGRSGSFGGGSSGGGGAGGSY